jgi:hypothetical protein
VLRVVTSLNTSVLTESGQAGNPISVSSSPSSSPTPIATTQPTQVSSVMAPPPAPVVNGTWIQPYELPANAPPADPRANLRTRRLLANSGVSVMTGYSLPTSPRETTAECNARLYYWRCTITSNQSGLTVGDSKSNFKGNADLTTKVVVPIPEFQSFSWDSTVQPRTDAARAHGLRDDVSPGTKETNNKRKHAEMTKETSKESSESSESSKKTKHSEQSKE